MASKLKGNVLLFGGSVLAIALLAKARKQMNISEYGQARFFTPGRKSRPIWIVIHTAETKETEDAAEALARYASKMPDNRHASWHYSVDSNSVQKSVEETDTAWAVGPGNGLSINIELAGTAAQSKAQWDDTYSRSLLDQAARLVADIATRNQIPLVHPTTEDVLALVPGVIGHDQVSRASALAEQRLMKKSPWWNGATWVRTNHYDPGPNFPWTSFIELAREYVGSAPPMTVASTDGVPRRSVMGERGNDVMRWQRFLNEKGFGPLVEDGIHGPRTETASKRYLSGSV